MPGAAQRAEVCRIGPRALSFLLQPPGTVPVALLSNCKKLLAATTQVPFVLGEDGDTESVALLVTGWYRFEVTNLLPLWVQQVSPQDIPATDPAVTGIRLEDGDVFNFYVDEDRRDGALVVQQCDTTQAPKLCNTEEVPLATVNRLDTTRKMVDTGNTLSVQVLRGRRSPKGAC